MTSPTEKISEAFGQARGAVKAMIHGGGIFKRLATEHGEVSALMMRVAASTKGSEVRRELFPKIRQELLAHAHAEEQEFYERVRNHPDAGGLVEHSYDEHQEIEQLLETLAMTDTADESWHGMFMQLVKIVQHHVSEEEGKVFRKAKDLFSESDLEAIEQRYLATKSQELTRVV
jgi:hemerythrin superfamily protein